MTAGITDTAHAVEATTVMRLLPKRPRLLALGEPTHGEDVLLDLRNELFRQLVEQEGYRTITIESDCMMGLVVDDYVTSGTGTLDEVPDPSGQQRRDCVRQERPTKLGSLSVQHSDRPYRLLTTPISDVRNGRSGSST